MKFLARIPFVARRRARIRAEHRRLIGQLVALRRAAVDQAADPDTEVTRRIYRLKLDGQAVGMSGRHRAA